MEKKVSSPGERKTAAKTTAADEKKTARKMDDESIRRCIQGRYDGVSCVSRPVYGFYSELEQGGRFNVCRVEVTPEADSLVIRVQLPVRVMEWEVPELAEYLHELNTCYLHGYECFWVDPFTEKIFYRLFSERPTSDDEIALVVRRAISSAESHLDDIAARLAEIAERARPEPKGRYAGETGGTGKKSRSGGLMGKLLSCIGLKELGIEPDDDEFDLDDDGGKDK